MNKGTVVITGGSRGIGAATAILAAKNGYAVAFNYYRDKEAANHVVYQIRQMSGQCIAVQADVSKHADISKLFAAAETLGEVSGLVNNAGVLEKQSQLSEIDGDRIDRIFAVNVRGSFLCAAEAVRRMSTASGGTGGSIVNVSSAASRLGGAGEYIDYAASKGAIDTMTIGLSKEVADQGIRVNAVRPGLIDTDIHASGGEPTRIERVKPSIPMRRGGQTEEVAEAIVWLLSSASSYCTGSFIDVSGGR